MKYFFVSILQIICLFSLQGKDFIHPGVLHTNESIEKMRQLINSRTEPAYGSFLLLKEHKCSQADYRMEGPFRVISRDGEFRHTKSRMETDFSAAYQNALMWALTGEEAHARKSLEILTAYADTLTVIPETNDAPLLAGLEGLKIIYALEMLKHTYPGAWGDQLRKPVKMFREIFLPVLDGFYARKPYTNGNWGFIVTKTYMAAGIFLDDRKMYSRAIDFYLHANDNGTIENYAGETGQLQESGRDQGHCMLAIGSMATVCEIAWQQGDDLYSALDSRLLKAFEYTAKYNLGYDVPFTRWTDITGKYSDRTQISDVSRGNFKPVFEMAYNHYVNRKGLSMPYTLQVLKKIRPEGFDRDQPSFGSLLFNSSDSGRIVTYPVPREIIYARHNDDFTVQVRNAGGDWTDLYEYSVNVDMDTRSVASMVQFDFSGKVELRVKVNNGIVHDVKIRPLNKGIQHSVGGNIVSFSLYKPEKLSLEVNGDRLHNLHIFANGLEKEKPNPDDPGVMYFGEGLHKPKEGDAFNIPSNTTVYFAPGAVVQGKFVCSGVENVRFVGHGIILEPYRGFEITHSKNIEIDGPTVVNPAHYTVYGGETAGLKITNLKSFSNKGWSDGIDLMSCSDVEISDIFMRNSDDCIAIYTHRWDYYGDARNYIVKNAILWADIAHPVNIGLHGDTGKEVNLIENLRFSEIDILEHDEDDRNYQGCIAFSVSDHNLVRDVTFENIRIENIQEGQLVNLRVLFNEKYSAGPGKGIQNVTFRNIFYSGSGENTSVIEGFSKEYNIDNVLFENLVINGKKIRSLEEGNIKTGKYTDRIEIK
jgi:hypothetical protein